MSSFFTLPSSQKKRKRSDQDKISTTKRQREQSKQISRKPKPSRETRDESISGSDSESNSPEPGLTTDDGGSDSSEYENETAAEKRLKNAEKALEGRVSAQSPVSSINITAITKPPETGSCCIDLPYPTRNTPSYQ